MWTVIGVIGGLFLIGGFVITILCAVEKAKCFMEGLK